MAVQTKKCPLCAEEIPAEAAVCPFCGTPLTEPDRQAAPPPASPVIAPQAWTAPQQPPAQKSNTWIGWAIGGGAFVLLCFAAAILLLMNGEKLSALLTPATPTRTPRPTATSTTTPLPPVEVSLWCIDSPTYTVNAGQPVIFYWIWGTASEAYAQDYADAASFSVRVDGEALDISRAASSQYSCDWDFCIGWQLPPFYLEKGTHSVVLTVTLDREITDGYDLDQNGKLDTYGPGAETFPSCIIVVR